MAACGGSRASRDAGPPAPTVRARPSLLFDPSAPSYNRPGLPSPVGPPAYPQPAPSDPTHCHNPTRARTL